MASISTAAAQARVKLLLLQAHLQAHLQANLQAQLKLFPLHASLAAIATPL